MDVTTVGTPSVTEKVRQWLDQGGYPLEMRVARALNDAGFTVRQSAYYEAATASGGIAREVDVLGWRATGTSSPLLVVECKSKPEPWVLFIGEPAIEDVPEPLAERLFTYMLGEPLPGAWPTAEAPLLELQPTWGHSLVAMSTTNNARDSAHDAVRQVISAANGVLGGVDADSAYGTVAFPVIVTSGALAAVRLGADGQAINIDQVNRVQLRRVDPAASARPFLIDIITEDALQEYAKDAYATFAALDLGR